MHVGELEVHDMYGTAEIKTKLGVLGCYATQEGGEGCLVADGTERIESGWRVFITKPGMGTLVALASPLLSTYISNERRAAQWQLMKQ